MKESDIREMSEPVIRASTERLRSPFIASFLIAWVITNWRCSAILFLGTAPIETRIAGAEATLSAVTTLYLPLCVAALYTFVWPWVAYLVDGYQGWIGVLGRRRRLAEEHDLQLQRRQNKFAEIRLEVNEKHAVEKLIKSQAELQKLVAEHEAFILRADKLLEEVEARREVHRGMTESFLSLVEFQRGLSKQTEQADSNVRERPSRGARGRRSSE